MHKSYRVPCFLPTKNQIIRDKDRRKNHVGGGRATATGDDWSRGAKREAGPPFKRKWRRQQIISISKDCVYTGLEGKGVKEIWGGGKKNPTAHCQPAEVDLFHKSNKLQVLVETISL